ncbi:alpha-L-fucosidase [Niabella sp. W65]|nr:alpha-L-fucosidase [Niabella sp. W65]MCH7366230.1 alpha-L-fucosidase [Niabella sp. W65]
MNGSWGYKSWDHNWKSTELLIRNLVDIASKGGNYLLNIGPKEDGSVPQESIDRLAQIGNWMKVNGNAIYATKASPLQDLDWGRCTIKTDGKNTRLNLFVFNWPANGKLVVPAITNKAVEARLVATGKKLDVKNENGTIVIGVPAAAPDKIASLIQLTVTGEVANINIKGTQKMKTGELD